jgi:hypothetical protein
MLDLLILSILAQGFGYGGSGDSGSDIANGAIGAGVFILLLIIVIFAFAVLWDYANGKENSEGDGRHDVGLDK